jgi:hypothetical protein
MVVLNCQRLRKIVMLAGVFLITGMFIEVIVHLLASSIDLLFIQPIALGMVLVSPLIILLTVVISLIPGLSLRDCAN